MPFIDTSQSIPALFARQAKETPSLVALQDVSRTLTYAELDAETARLATRLRRMGVGRDSLVGIYMGRSADYVVACLAALRAGGAFLVLELAYPPNLLADVVANASPVTVLTRSEHVRGLPSGVPLIVMDGKGGTEGEKDAPDEQGELPPLPADDDLDRLCFVSYSSGTTGKPKGIANPMSAPVRSYDLRFGVSDLGPGDHVACNVFFVWEMLRPLIRGASVFAVPDSASYDPAALVEMLVEREITETLMTPTLLATVLTRYPEGLGDRMPSLRTLWLNGEVVTTDLGRRARAAMPGTRVLNCYSASETHEIACGDVAGYLDDADLTVCPVGPPTEPDFIYIMDESNNRLPPGEKGELWVGGSLLARGYLNLPETTARSFFPDPFSPLPGARMYRTGDGARLLPNGHLEITGRIGSMIKLRGYSIQPGAVETAVLTHLAVDHCHVSAHGDGLERQLVAYIEIHRSGGEEEEEEGGGGRKNGKKEKKKRVVPVVDEAGHSPNARRALAPHLAHYMIPSLWVPMSEWPTHEVSGKIDTRALPAPPTVPREIPTPRVNGVGSGVGGLPPLNRTPEANTIARLWAESLNLPVASVLGDENTFFDLGGHSLTLADLSARMTARFGFPVPPGLLAERPTLEGHALVVGAARDGHTASMQADLPAVIRTDSVLSDDIRPATKLSFKPLTEAATILLTGATGFLGAFLLNTLLETTSAEIVCLVRFADPTADVRPAGMARLRRCLIEHGVWNEQVPDRIRILPGNLASPLLGLSKENFARLAAQVDAVVHAGAAVNLVYPYAAVRNTNVGGTREILRLACRAGSTLHYVSTNGVLPASPPGRGWSENDTLGMADVPTRLPDGYGQTKWVAERLVCEAGDRGLPVRIYRPGNISGDSRSGAANSYDLLNAIIVESINISAAPSVPGWLLEMTAVDFVAKAIVALGSVPGGGRQRIFHLGDPNPPPAAEVFHSLITIGYPVEFVPFDAWKARWVEARGSANVGDDVFTVDVLKGGMPTAESLAAVPVLADALTAPVLRSLGLERPGFTRTLLEIYTRHAFSLGWLSHPPTTRLVPSAATPRQRQRQHGPPTDDTRPPPPPSSSPPTTGPFVGKVAVVTGASSGIGAAVAAALASRGAGVVLAARRVDALEGVRDAILSGTPDARLLLHATDVTDLAQVRALVQAATEQLGPVDILVACAGVMYYTMMANANMEQWNNTVAVNCTGFLNTLGAVVPGMLARGGGGKRPAAGEGGAAQPQPQPQPGPPCHVVAISSDAGRKVFPGLGVYSASKFFVEAALQSLRLETIGTGLRVTSVQPGNVDTGLVGMSTDREAIDKYAGLDVPAKVLSAEDVAEAVVWALRQPEHVAVNEVLVEPREQPI